MTTADKPTTKLAFRDFAAQVTIDGKALRVYAPEYDEETKTASGWIASEPGKEYAVNFTRTKDVGSDAIGNLYLDGSGNRRTGQYIYRHDQPNTWRSLRGERTGAGLSRRHFTFAVLQPTDDPHLLVRPCTAADPGKIELHIRRVVVLEERDMIEVNHLEIGSTYVHEQTKKLGRHVTDLGREYEGLPGNPRKWKIFSANDGDRYVKFVFNYRSADMLLAMGIIPRQRAKAIQDSISKGEDYFDDEEKEDSDLERREAEIVALQATLKARRDAVAAKREVKIEAGGASLRWVKKEHSLIDLSNMPGEVIDLTSD